MLIRVTTLSIVLHFLFTSLLFSNNVLQDAVETHGSYNIGDKLFINTSDISIHNEPSFKGVVVKKTTLGDMIEITEKSCSKLPVPNCWYEAIFFDGIVGWVNENWIACDEQIEKIKFEQQKIVENELREKQKRLDAIVAERKRKIDSTGGGPLLISRIRSTNPHSAGGVHVRISFENISEKRIKYIRFSATPFNRVGDSVRCRIQRRSRQILVSTGPYKPWSTDTSYWENVWYNHSISCIEVEIVSVEFMDGSKTYVVNTERALVKGLNNSCKVE